MPPTRLFRLGWIILTIAILASSRLSLAQQPVELAGTLEGHSNPAYAIGWSPDGSRIVTGGFDQSIRVWDAASR